MKREIKFRFYDKKKDAMVYCETEYFDYLSKFFIEYDNTSPELGNTALMCYTDIEDDEGAMIYEGDIVQCGYGKGKIIYNDRNAAFMIEWIDEPDCNMEFINIDPRGNVRSVSIIGNIYENPDLLK